MTELVDGLAESGVGALALLSHDRLSSVADLNSLAQGRPVLLHLLWIHCLLVRHVPLARIVLHDAEPIAHMTPPVLLQPGEVDEQPALLPLVAVVELVCVVPDPGLEEHVPRKLRLVEDVLHGLLVHAHVQVDFRLEHGERHCLCEHLDRPLVHVEEEGAGVETVLIFVADEVNVFKVGRREEAFKWDRRVDQDQVGVNPPGSNL